MRGGARRERGSASVEQAGLAALIALLLATAIAAVAAGGEIDAGRGLRRGDRAATRLRAPPARRLPAPPARPCLRLAAGPPRARPGAGPGRSHRPLRPAARPGRLPPLPARKLRGRRRTSPATASGRRTTAFTQIDDRRRSLGWVELTYWLYRPGLGWERVVRRAGPTQVEAASHVSVLLKDDPALVPLETLPGRDQYEFPAGERPPWQWHVHGTYPGWSS